MNALKIRFDTPIYKNIDEIYFVEDNNKVYYDSCNMNYISSVKTNSQSHNQNQNHNKNQNQNIEIKFYGFYKDDFFVIIIDSFDNDLLVNIECKEVILIKLEWKKMYFGNRDIHINVVKSTKNDKREAYLLNIRNKLFKNNIDINSLLLLNDYKIINATINGNGNSNRKEIDSHDGEKKLNVLGGLKKLILLVKDNI